MAYSFFLDKVQLPVPPSKLQTKISNKNKTIVLINEGEINFLKSAGLTEISFEVMIPQNKYPFAIYRGGFKKAKYYLDHFEQLKVNKKPFQFIVTRVSPGGKLLFTTNMKVSLEEYTITEDAGEGLDLIVAIRLKQYRDFGTKKLTVEKKENNVVTVSSSNTREVTKEMPKTYTVVSGDTLWKICQKHLGDGSKYSEIAALNGIANPNLIYPGMVIKLE